MHQRRPPGPPPAQPNVTALKLFTSFSWVGLSAFGGALPWARQMLVEKRQWLTEEEFTNILSLCQFLPGGNILNVAICVGSRFAGLPGAIAAFMGLLGMPVVLVLLLAMLYSSYSHLEPVEAAFRGISAAAAGLIVAMAIRMAYPLRRNLRAIFFAVSVIAAVLVWRVPLVWILLGLVPPSIAAAWLLRR
jgi:chromate transporter